MESDQGWFYFMLLGLVPADRRNPVMVGDYAIYPRHWSVGPWDWALLATEHEMGVPWQVADAQAHSCNVEVAIKAASMDAARERFRWLHVGLLLHGVPPFSAPFVSTHSVNAFSNLKGSAADRADTRYEVARRIVRREEIVYFKWNTHVNGAMQRSDGDPPELTGEILTSSINDARTWERLAANQPLLLALRDTFVAAPQIADIGQSVLHMWTGLEGLFPDVQAEVSFRLALYLAQMAAPSGDRLAMFDRVKKGYRVRSKIAHGGRLPNDSARDTWIEQWQLSCDVTRAILDRGALPNQEELILELLGPRDPT